MSRDLDRSHGLSVPSIRFILCIIGAMAAIASSPPLADAAVSIESVFPDRSPGEQLIALRVLGSQFEPTDQVWLQDAGGGRITADVRFVSSDTLICGLDLTGHPMGGYMLVVQSPGGDQAMLPDAFHLNEAVHWSDEIQISDTPTETASLAVAASPEGSAWVVWNETYSQFSLDVFARHGTGLLWDPVESLTTDANTNFRPRIAVDSRAVAHAVWCDFNLIFYERRTQNSWSPESLLVNRPSGAMNPTIATDRFGRVHVAWADYRNGDYPDVYYKRLENGAWTPEERLSDSPFLDTDIVVCADAVGDVHVAWSGAYTWGDGAIYYRRLHGSVWSPPERISTGTYYTYETALAAGSNGDVHIAWTEGSNLLYRHKGPGGWGDVEVLSQGAKHPSFTADPYGCVHLAYSSTKDASYEDIYYRRHNGFRWGQEERLTNDWHTSTYAMISADTTGGLYLAWKDERSGHSDVYLRHRPPFAQSNPRLDRVSKSSGWSFGATEMTGWGAGIVPPARLELTAHGQPNRIAETIAETRDSIRVRFDLTDAPDIDWNILLRNGDGRVDSLPNAFTTVAGPWSGPERLTNQGGLSKLADAGGCLARDQDGELHLVYQDNEHGGSYWYIFWMHTVNGQWTSRVKIVDSPNTGSYGDPVIVPLSTGDLLIAWTDWRYGNENGDIYYKIYTGGQWGPDRRLTYDPHLSFYPTLAADTDGSAHLIWLDHLSGDDAILYSHWNGLQWSAPERISVTQGEIGYPSIATDGLGKVYAGWGLWSGGTNEAVVRVHDTSGWHPESVVSGSSVSANSPALASDGRGITYAAWIDHRNGSPEIFERRLDVPSLEQRVTSLRSWHDVRPNLAMTPDGGRHITWTDERFGLFQVFMKSFENGVWSPDHDVSASPTRADLACILAGPANDLDIVWQDQRDGNDEVYIRNRRLGAAAIPSEELRAEGAPAVRIVPNPFQDRLSLVMPRPVCGPVRMELFDLLGRKVRTIQWGDPGCGLRSLVWDINGAQGRGLGSGAYFYRIESPSIHQRGRIVCVR